MNERKLTRISMCKVTEIWVNGIPIYHGTVKNAVEVAKQYQYDEFEFQFNVFCAPNLEREIKKYVRRAKKIANMIGVEIDKPKQRVLGGYLHPEVYTIKAKKM